MSDLEAHDDRARRLRKPGSHRGSERPWPAPELTYEQSAGVWPPSGPAPHGPAPHGPPAHGPAPHGPVPLGPPHRGALPAPTAAPGSMPVPAGRRELAPGASEALVLGIAGLLFCGLSSPFAVVAASRARREIRRNPGVYEGEGYAMAGLVTGWIGTACVMMGFAMLVALFFGGIFFL